MDEKDIIEKQKLVIKNLKKQVKSLELKFNNTKLNKEYMRVNALRSYWYDKYDKEKTAKNLLTEELHKEQKKLKKVNKVNKKLSKIISNK